MKMIKLIDNNSKNITYLFLRQIKSNTEYRGLRLFLKHPAGLMDWLDDGESVQACTCR